MAAGGAGHEGPREDRRAPRRAVRRRSRRDNVYWSSVAGCVYCADGSPAEEPSSSCTDRAACARGNRPTGWFCGDQGALPDCRKSSRAAPPRSPASVGWAPPSSARCAGSHRLALDGGLESKNMAGFRARRKLKVRRASEVHGHHPHARADWYSNRAEYAPCVAFVVAPPCAGHALLESVAHAVRPGFRFGVVCDVGYAPPVLGAPVISLPRVIAREDLVAQCERPGGERNRSGQGRKRRLSLTAEARLALV